MKSRSKPERPLGSAMDSAYFVSPDGRFAAMQGTRPRPWNAGRPADAHSSWSSRVGQTSRGTQLRRHGPGVPAGALGGSRGAPGRSPQGCGGLGLMPRRRRQVMKGPRGDLGNQRPGCSSSPCLSRPRRLPSPPAAARVALSTSSPTPRQRRRPHCRRRPSRHHRVRARREPGLGGNRDIFVVNTDGTGLRRLTDDPAWEESPSWSRPAARSPGPSPTGAILTSA